MSAPAEAVPARTLRRFDAVALAIWALLVALQLGWIPFARYGWAFNLWAYLPVPVGVVFAIAALLVCFAPVRAALAARGRRTAQRIAMWPPGRRRALVVVGLVGFGLAMWLLRERYAAGDSILLVFAARTGWTFVFQEPGATFFIHQMVALFDLLGWGSMNGVRALSCLCAVPTVLFLAGAARHLAPTGARSAVVAIVLSGGLLRIFAGHAEVYAPLLMSASAYVYAALAFLDRRCGGWVPAFAFGIALWMHIAAVALGPSLLVLPWLVAAREGDAPRLARAFASGLLAGVPMLLFVVGLLAFDHHNEVFRAWRSLLEVAGRSSDPQAVRWWVRGWGSYPSIGTDVIFLSWPHLKYLLNAATLLVPATIPILLGWVILRRGPSFASAQARFLFAAAAPLVVYACLLRPFWGPYDWDLFSMTALVLALLAAHVITNGLPSGLRPHAVIFIVVVQLVFFGLPFIGAGLGTWRDGGPFQPYRWQLDLRAPRTPPPDVLAPWL